MTRRNPRESGGGNEWFGRPGAPPRLQRCGRDRTRFHDRRGDFRCLRARRGRSGDRSGGRAGTRGGSRVPECQRLGAARCAVPHLRRHLHLRPGTVGRVARLPGGLGLRDRQDRQFGRDGSHLRRVRRARRVAEACGDCGRGGTGCDQLPGRHAHGTACPSDRDRGAGGARRRRRLRPPRRPAAACTRGYARLVRGAAVRRAAVLRVRRLRADRDHGRGGDRSRPDHSPRNPHRARSDPRRLRRGGVDRLAGAGPKRVGGGDGAARSDRRGRGLGLGRAGGPAGGCRCGAGRTVGVDRRGGADRVGDGSPRRSPPMVGGGAPPLPGAAPRGGGTRGRGECPCPPAGRAGSNWVFLLWSAPLLRRSERRGVHPGRSLPAVSPLAPGGWRGRLSGAGRHPALAVDCLRDRGPRRGGGLPGHPT